MGFRYLIFIFIRISTNIHIFRVFYEFALILGFPDIFVARRKLELRLDALNYQEIKSL